MTEARPDPATAEREAAAEWVVRLRPPEAGEADWLAFEAWLKAAPDHRAAYDVILALSEEVDTQAPALKAMLEPRPPAGAASLETRRAQRFSGGLSRGAVAGWRLAAATAAAAAVVALFTFGPLFLTGRPAPASAAVYETAKGERRTVTLPDGSHIDLNGASHMSVLYRADRREVVLGDAEAAFSVTHDAARPFLISLGGRTARVVGTEFDVLRHDGRIAVTVRRGVVEVAAGADAPVRVTAGRRLTAAEGARGEVVETIGDAEALGWRTSRLIYRQRPLGEVVSDLGRYFHEPLRIEGSRTAALNFSGVLVVDQEDEIIRRIEALLPVSATRAGGAIVFRSNDTGR